MEIGRQIRQVSISCKLKYKSKYLTLIAKLAVFGNIQCVPTQEGYENY